MSLNTSKSFSGVVSKSHHKFKTKTGTLPRHKRSPRPSTSDDDKIGEISVSQYRTVVTDPGSNHNRRALLVRRNADGSLGFTLQTYGLYHEDTGDLEVWTYVDQVELDGPARKAGMRPGDVIISVNGEATEAAEHKKVVDLIRNSDDDVRMVVLFQDCVRKVKLHQELLRLKAILDAKERLLQKLTEREAKIIQHGHRSSGEGAVLPQSSLRRTKLTSSLPLLPTAHVPTIRKSSSMVNAQRPVPDLSVPQDLLRSRHLSAPRVLGSEIRLLDPATIASVGGTSSPILGRTPPKSTSAMIAAPKLARPGVAARRSASSVSSVPGPKAEVVKAPMTPPAKSKSPSRSKGLRRQGAIKGVSPRLGIRSPGSQRYSSDIDEMGSDSTDDDAFVNMTPKSSPPATPVRPSALKLGAVTPRSGLVGKDLVTRDNTTLGVPKVLTILSPRSKTPEPRMLPKSPVRARPLTPVILEPIDADTKVDDIQPISDLDTPDSSPMDSDNGVRQPIRDRFTIGIQPIVGDDPVSDDSGEDQEEKLIEMRRTRQPMKRIASTDFTLADPVRLSRIRERCTIDLDDLPAITATSDDVIDNEPIRNNGVTLANEIKEPVADDQDDFDSELSEPVGDNNHSVNNEIDKLEIEEVDLSDDVDGRISEQVLNNENNGLNNVNQKLELVNENDEDTPL